MDQLFRNTIAYSIDAKNAVCCCCARALIPM